MNADKRRLKVLVLSALICVNLRPISWAADDAPGARKSAPAAPATKNKAAPTGASSKATKAAPAPSVRTRPQMAPTKERYKEIQQALASKGYLAPAAANGQWTAASSDALKRFQANQNLEATGRINSLSLIALGLGPKHEGGPRRTPAP